MCVEDVVFALRRNQRSIPNTFSEFELKDLIYNVKQMKRQIEFERLGILFDWLEG